MLFTSSDKYGLKLFIKVLSLIKRNSPIISKDIEFSFNIKKSFVSSILSSMEKDGLILREKNGKEKKVYITKLGLSVIKESVWQLLTEKEIQVLSRIMK